MREVSALICSLNSTADKESLTTELTKLQQSYRHVKGDLAGKMEQLAQSEANRKSAEEKIRQLTVHQNSAVRKCFNPLCPKNDQLQFSSNSIS